MTATDDGKGTEMRPLAPQAEQVDLFTVLASLSEPIRLSIVLELSRADDIECGTFDVPVGKSTISHHLRVLRAAGVIATTRQGTRSLNRLRRAELDAALPGLLDAVLASAPTSGAPTSP